MWPSLLDSSNLCYRKREEKIKRLVGVKRFYRETPKGGSNSVVEQLSSIQFSSVFSSQHHTGQRTEEGRLMQK